jgi:hypothetical protein
LEVGGRVVHHGKFGSPMSALGHSRPSDFVPVLNNVRYASDSDHSRYESELTLWAMSDRLHCGKTANLFADHQQRGRSSALPTGFSEAVEHVGVVFWPKPGRAFADLKVERGRRDRDGLL